MRYLFCAGLMLLPFTAALDALLPPLYQTADEIVAVVKNRDLDKVLPDGEPIIEILKNEHGYLIITPKHRVQAILTYQPAARPGPAHFNVTFQAAYSNEVR